MVVKILILTEWQFKRKIKVIFKKLLKIKFLNKKKN